MYRIGPNQKKILLTIISGITLGMQRNSLQYFKTLKAIRYEWKKINKQSFENSIQGLVNQKLLRQKYTKNKGFVLELTPAGKIQAKKLTILGNTIKFKHPKRWDKKWRLVIFDIPEKNRVFRNILRSHLKNLDFKKLQHSVFVSPHPFEKSVQELVDLYLAKKYVRIITAYKIDNNKELKKYFFKNNKSPNNKNKYTKS